MEIWNKKKNRKKVLSEREEGEGRKERKKRTEGGWRYGGKRRIERGC